MKMRKIYLMVIVYAGMSLVSAFVQAAAKPNPTPSPGPAEKAATDKANALLTNARMHAQVEDYATAEKLIREAVTTDPNNPETRKAAERDWKEIIEKVKANKETEDEKTKSKQLAQLQEAERLLSEGKTDKASETVQNVLKETTDPNVIEKAKQISDKIHPYQFGLFNNALQRLYVVGGWAIDILLGILLLFLGYLLVQLLRWLWALIYRKKWLILEINDSSTRGIGELVIDSLRQLSAQGGGSVSAGLLALERPQFPSLVHLLPAQVDVDPTPAIEALNLQIGAVNIGAFAKVLVALRKWINTSRSHITGRVITSESQVTVYLTRRSASGKTNLVSATCDGAVNVNADSTVAKAASYKMYYLIAKEQTKKEISIAEADAAEKLSEGLEQLRRYIYDQYTEGPQKAYEIFSHIRSEQPMLRVAYLYEGIALDLMERHDEAISRFDYLAEDDSDKQLKDKALYNKGISLFRKYTPQNLGDAIRVLSYLVSQEQNLAAHPIKALAEAAKANVIAHRPIFWQSILFGDRSRDDNVTRERKELASRWIDKWVSRVEEITESLEHVYKASKESKAWDAISSEQLHWAVFNARGNIYMNCANHFFVQPHRNGQEANMRNKYLEQAHAAFQKCLLILPAGVETLTNLSTVLLSLSRTVDARAYAEAAIKLNPNYEYAYYRKAQSWENENRTDKVVEVLRGFANIKKPNIPGFQDIYRKYAFDLARPL